MQHWLPWLNIPSQTACACKQNFKRMNFYTPRQQNFKRMNFYTPRQWNTKTQSFQKSKKVANHLRVDNNKTKLITILICNIAQDTNWTKKKRDFHQVGCRCRRHRPGRRSNTHDEKHDREPTHVSLAGGCHDRDRRSICREQTQIILLHVYYIRLNEI